ncbi:MAG TPA: hypothetical protein DCL81_15160 [Algoriphagus sp.]|jgi:hypothetical protein|nr:hypothetical protein [Algoriphagus sp.]MAN85562.1 hypothetical protein [Algoriphagus sp.]HAH37792.1 hypothetical protein [Algoriphagus sp.]HAS58503.1 hypothetical protein [Algoriphagus sp.]HCX77517.1 hypothetical protein [Algoriphagus sp.]|tara:strand:+ start:5134 stop:5337 length:204 start_codon:yes stop_codon:yes gene_type:complete
MLSRNKIRKYLRVKWDISFRRAFVAKSENEQIGELVQASREISQFAKHTRQLLEIIEESKLKLWTST